MLFVRLRRWVRAQVRVALWEQQRNHTNELLGAGVRRAWLHIHLKRWVAQCVAKIRARRKQVARSKKTGYTKLDRND